MAKILVADDNSNIQKMVGLALKDHGIDVVAVGNGEAAVRKISDMRPDLILADVFMPVRNGYEVCKYVKEDSALSHIPVILLVGAFDPLDEQEAQRVGADGVLKKPFVPPDPLISMVKSALVRAGVPHSGFNPVSEEPPAETVPEPPRRVATVMSLPEVELPYLEAESFVEEVPARPAAQKIESGSQPLAFSSLLAGANAETEEDLQNIPTVHPELAQERDWRALEVEEDEEEAPEDTRSSWRRDGGDASLSDEAAATTNDWRGQGPSTRSSSHERWTPTREKQDLTEAAEVPGTAVATETTSVSPAAPFASNAWTAAIGVASDDETVVVEAEKETAAPPAAIPEVMPEHKNSTYVEPDRFADPAAKDETPSPAAVEPEQPSAASSWFSTAPSPWDAEALKASQLAATWETAAPPPANETSAQVEPLISVPFDSSRTAEVIEVASERAASEITEAAADTVREEVSRAETHEAGGTGESDHTAEETSERAANLDIDAVVAKVLARMKPEVLQEVTREILKPVVEANVREELSSHRQ